MKNEFTTRQLELIEMLSVNGNVACERLSQKAAAGTLSSNEIEFLCGIISNELMMKGIEETFEPNAYGKELEALLDAVNRPRLHG
jgi:hypothetical protein